MLEYEGPTITDDELEDRDNRYLFQLNDTYMIDGSDLSNLARYINHSCKPNAQAVLTNDETHVTIEAIKRINPGDEITINYGTEYFEEFIAPIGCRCKACRKAKKK